MSETEGGLVRPLREDEAMGTAFATAYILINLERERLRLMTNPKGTKSETAVVNWAKRNEFWNSDRLTKRGNRDRGDVRIGLSLMVQVKDGYTDGREPSDYLIGKWLDKVDEQKKEGGWEWGLLVHKRAGKGDPDMWRWYIDGATFRKMVLAPGPFGGHISLPFPQYVQLQGYMIPPLIKNAGAYT